MCLASLSMIPPELLHLIASFLPSRSAPGTLQSLARVNRRFYNIVSPILHSRLILRGEKKALSVIQKILDTPQLGMAITELYIMSELSFYVDEDKRQFDVLVGLQMLIQKKLIPRLCALGVYLLTGWHYDEYSDPVLFHGRLPVEFWKSLRSECPRLHTLALRNVGHGSNHQWLSGPVIDEINSFLSLSSIRFEWSGDSEGLLPEDNLRIFDNLPLHAASLHTLSLESDYQDPVDIIYLDFPNLKRLCLRRFNSYGQTIKITIFFLRHPQLESLSLLDCRGNWFWDYIKAGFLPNLKHLKATFIDVRSLVAILNQLVSLAIFECKNSQVPHFFRVVMPDGLPHLKSLEIKQTYEDGQWSAVKVMNHGSNKRRKKMKHFKYVMNGFMRSIVKTAPNLEELGLHGLPLDSVSLRFNAHTLAQLASMERFYYRGMPANPQNSVMLMTDFNEGVADFLDGAEALARMCTRLTTVTSIHRRYFPYLSANIGRDSDGEVTGVVWSQDGVGMLISADENDPFPRNP